MGEDRAPRPASTRLLAGCSSADASQGPTPEAPVTSPNEKACDVEGPDRRPCAIFHDQVVAQGARGAELAAFDEACATP
jgi:uncharacterized lipoprotein YajG